MKETNILPFGNISTAEDLGRCVRAQRKSQGATQAEFASLCGVGVRFTEAKGGRDGTVASDQPAAVGQAAAPEPR